MTKYSVQPIDEENRFARDEIIVSKTDLKGKIVYGNDIFCRMAEMTTEEIIGQPHSIIRHPDMPRAVFKLLWDTISMGEEIFAYVKNMSKSGRYYWVHAHVTPSFDLNNNIIGYHSNRRSPTRKAIDQISAIYTQLLAEETRQTNAKAGLDASFAMLVGLLEDQGVTYSEFFWSIGE